MTTRVALLGHPVGHSRSPAMHNAAFRELGLDWRYDAVDVAPERFAEVLRSLPEQGFVGANVTIPHKLRALEAAHELTDVARAVGAANTLTFAGGRVRADNTDVEGFVTALRERVPQAPAGMSALVLGAGGAARAVVYALLSAGAARVDVWNRHPERAQELVDDLAHAAGKTALHSAMEPSMASIDLLVNATSLGMRHADESPEPGEGGEFFKAVPLSADELDDRLTVVDLVYRHDRTPLMRAALARGLRRIDGFDVLVHQGAASFRIWTGMRAPLGAMRSGATDGED
ncbi:MAG: shikimate dehydrogenase [Solirubrobacterales bacterium]